MWRMHGLLAGLLAATAPPVQAAICTEPAWEGVPMVACEVDPTLTDLRLFHTGPDGKILGRFCRVEDMARAEGKSPAFAMNAGMSRQDHAPVGLYTENRQEIAPLITHRGSGNFGLLPNGVFRVRKGRADVPETKHFAIIRPDCTSASQSGLLPVIDGTLHPRFLEGSTSVYTRNGVGTSHDGTRAVFVIADEQGNFHRFERFFRDAPETPNALYFDGSISNLRWLAGRCRDFGLSMGPIMGV
ncbi:MAG: phosphodiester glycosidase family protein [Rhodobacteraceae bacterium]|nr:phosphodiester glycosidase family protein [Paracoccaceae bacterium]